MIQTHLRIKNRQTLSKTNIRLIKAILLIGFPTDIFSGSCTNPISQPPWEPYRKIVLTTQGGVELPECNDICDATRIFQSLRSLYPSRYGDKSISLAFMKAREGQLPECYQYDHTGDSRLYQKNYYVDLLLGTAFEDGTFAQTIGSIQYSSLTESTSITASQLRSDLQGIPGVPIGMLLIDIYLEDPNQAYYLLYDYGGYNYTCHSSCNGCTGPGVSQCSACKNPEEWTLVRSEGAIEGPGECKKRCDSSCAEHQCTGPESNQCLECLNSADWVFTVVDEEKRVGSCTRRICHETCGTCSGSNQENCLTCRDISPNGQLTLRSNNECRCPTGQHYVLGELRCALCHPDCHSCIGAGSDQCLICSDPKSLVSKITGSEAGPCVDCADPARSRDPDCANRTATVELFSFITTQPTTTESISESNETFVPAKPPVRVPNGGKHLVRLTFPNSSILERINQLKESFVFTEFISVSIENLNRPADYTFSGEVNLPLNTYDLTFNFAKDYGFVEIKFEVIQNNYFILNLPNTSRRRSVRRRELQSFSSEKQQQLDDALLVQSGIISVKMWAINFSESRLKGLEEAGIHTRIYIFASLFIYAIGLIMKMMASKSDGRDLGKLFDYSFFIGFLTKIPYIPAAWTAYDMTFWDQIVRSDTLLMNYVVTEKTVRRNLKNKFIEYSIPVMTINNATNYASGFIISLIILGVMEKCLRKDNRVVIIAKTIIGILVSLTLPSTLFYSGMSSILYSSEEKRSTWVEILFYSIGFTAFLASIGFLIVVIFYEAISGSKMEAKDTLEESNDSSREEEQSNQQHQNQGRDQQQQQQRAQVVSKATQNKLRDVALTLLNIYQKISFDGVNKKFLKPSKIGLGVTKRATLHKFSLLRYSLMLLWIIVLQKSPKFMISLQTLTQLGMTSITFILCLKSEFESLAINILYTIFEVLMLILISGLFLSVVAVRETNSETGFLFGTLPLIGAMYLQIAVKLCLLVTSMINEYKRFSKKLKDEASQGEEVVIKGDLKGVQGSSSELGGLKSEMGQSDFMDQSTARNERVLKKKSERTEPILKKKSERTEPVLKKKRFDRAELVKKKHLKAMSKYSLNKNN